MDRQLQYMLRDIGAVIVVVLILFGIFMLFDLGLKAMGGIVGASVIGIGFLMRHLGWHFAQRIVSEQVQAVDERLFGERIDADAEGDLGSFDADAALDNYLQKRMRGEVQPLQGSSFGRKTG